MDDPNIPKKRRRSESEVDGGVDSGSDSEVGAPPASKKRKQIHVSPSSSPATASVIAAAESRDQEEEEEKKKQDDIEKKVNDPRGVPSLEFFTLFERIKPLCERDDVDWDSFKDPPSDPEPSPSPRRLKWNDRLIPMEDLLAQNARGVVDSSLGAAQDVEDSSSEEIEESLDTSSGSYESLHPAPDYPDSCTSSPQKFVV